VPVCRIELFGVPRLLAGSPGATVDLPEGAVVADALAGLAAQCPTLLGPVMRADGRSLTAGYLLCRDGKDFVRSPDTPVEEHDHLLLFATSAGGSP